MSGRRRATTRSSVPPTSSTLGDVGLGSAPLITQQHRRDVYDEHCQRKDSRMGRDEIQDGQHHDAPPRACARLWQALAQLG
jgi:hypothetical protein